MQPGRDVDLYAGNLLKSQIKQKSGNTGNTSRNTKAIYTQENKRDQ